MFNNEIHITYCSSRTLLVVLIFEDFNYTFLHLVLLFIKLDFQTNRKYSRNIFLSVYTTGRV